MKAFVTTPDHTRLLSPVGLEPTTARSNTTVTVSGQCLQTMQGFGASLTESSAYLLSRLPSAKRDALLRDLFGVGNVAGGVGFCVLRVPMGATDFSSRGSYTYNDLPAGETDPDLKRFAITPDEAYILPILRQIRKINPEITLMASPWTAPAWMKTSKNLHGGWLDWGSYGTYANYFVRFLQAYRKAGVPVNYVTVQNEPRQESGSYPTMRMEPNDQARFVRDYLAPAFRAARITAKILVWDHNWDTPDYPLAVLSDAGARAAIAGVAWHAYGGTPDAQDAIRRVYPRLETHFTESSGGAFAPNFGGNVRWDITNLVVGATKHGASTVLKWNLALDPAHGPRNGGCADCRGVVTIDPATGAVMRNEEYYAFGHASRFVRPGAVRLATSDAPDFPCAAFRNKNSSVVVVGANGDMKQTRVLRIECAGRPSVAVSVPAGAAVTVVYPAVK